MFDDTLREFTDDFDESDIDEIIDILTEGMLVHWLKPYLYKQELLENSLNTADFTTYSTAELCCVSGMHMQKHKRTILK